MVAKVTERQRRQEEITVAAREYLQTDAKVHLQPYSVDELKKVIEDLGQVDRDEPYYQAIQYRIQELELAESVATEVKVADLEVQGTLQSMEKQLRIMNMYLSNMTNLHFDKEDLI